MGKKGRGWGFEVLVLSGSEVKTPFGGAMLGLWGLMNQSLHDLSLRSITSDLRTYVTEYGIM